MHHVELDKIVLQSGAHDKPGYDSVCLLEAVSWWAEEKHKGEQEPLENFRREPTEDVPPAPVRKPRNGQQPPAPRLS